MVLLLSSSFALSFGVSGVLAFWRFGVLAFLAFGVLAFGVALYRE